MATVAISMAPSTDQKINFEAFIKSEYSQSFTNFKSFGYRTRDVQKQMLTIFYGFSICDSGLTNTYQWQKHRNHSTLFNI